MNILTQSNSLQQAVDAISLKDSHWMDLGKCFNSFDEAFWVIKCYYHDVLGYQLHHPESWQPENIITLVKGDSFVELTDGWEIRESSEVLTESMFRDISKLECMKNSIHPAKNALEMGVFGHMVYHKLLHATNSYRAKLRLREATKTYLIKNPVTKNYKIGKSTSPTRRCRDLKGLAGAELELLYVIDKDVEKELHRKFKIYQVYSEWFDDTDGLILNFFRVEGKRNKGVA